MIASFVRLTGVHARLFFREPMAWIFALAVPPLLLVVFAAIPSFRDAAPELGGGRVLDLYAPILIAIGVTIVGLHSLPQRVAADREAGLLRRMRTTPVRPLTVLAATVTLFVLVSVATLAIVLALGTAVGVPLPGNPAGFALAYVLTTVSVFCLGLLVAALAPTASSASAVGLLLFFPLAFTAGLWIPRERMPEALRAISDLTPVGAGVQSLQDAATGGWPSFTGILILGAWTVVAGGLAARTFRWE